MGLIEWYLGPAATVLSPRLDIFNVPAIGLNWEDSSARISDPRFVELLQDVGEEVGWKVFGVYPIGVNEVFANVKFEPVPDKVKPLGLKMRSMMMKSDELTVNALGFIATPLPFSEIPSAIMTGVIDGACGPAYCDLGPMQGTTKYIYDYFYRNEVQPLIMSLKVWNTLSDEDKAICEQAAKSALQVGWDLSKQINDEYRDKAVSEYGFEEVIYLTPEQHAANIKAIREQVWPALAPIIGKDLMDQFTVLATPVS